MKVMTSRSLHGRGDTTNSVILVNSLNIPWNLMYKEL